MSNWLRIMVPENWCCIPDLAIDRTTPMLFGLYSLFVLFGRALHPGGGIPLAQAAW